MKADLKLKNIRNKNISWLSFNERVLQEAKDKNNPLIQRIRFLGIFSSNLDEFTGVRIAALKRLNKLGRKARDLLTDDPREVLLEIKEIVEKQQRDHERTYKEIVHSLREKNVCILDRNELNEEQAEIVSKYFRENVRGVLMPMMFSQVKVAPHLISDNIYIIAELCTEQKKNEYALIRLPTDILPRFVSLKTKNRKSFVILLEEVIFTCLKEIFTPFSFISINIYSFQVTRDANLSIDDDILESYISKISKSLEKRKIGTPVRVAHSENMPRSVQEFIKDNLDLDGADVDFFPIGGSLRFRDFAGFPDVGSKRLKFRPHIQSKHPLLENSQSLMSCIEEQDILLHYPYHSFDYVINLLREASINPYVKSIKIALYRLADESKIVPTLINAVKNGKSVTAIIELQASFNEKANIEWANLMQKEGIKILHSKPELKVHAKMILITSTKKKVTTRYACIGTGNFNETTAKFYTDHTLLTVNPFLTKEVNEVFKLLENPFRDTSFNYLLVAPYNIRSRLVALIKREIKNHKNGKEAYIILKLNNLTDFRMINEVYKAIDAGVPVTLLVRGMFSLILSKNEDNSKIYAASIVDRFLEHSRILAFSNNGADDIYLTSADWMPRNLDRRVEVTCPILDKTLKSEILKYLNLQKTKSVKSRSLKGDLSNPTPWIGKRRKKSAQEEIDLWLKSI